MKKKLLLTLITAFVGLFAFGVINASAATYGDLTYIFWNGGVAITNCDESATEVTIPDTIEGYPVTEIGNSAFEYCSSLTSITIPDSVTSIGDEAFSCCSSLTSISIPDSVTSIGCEAFSWCTSLTSISIPNSVTSIGSYAFYYCSSLTSIVVDDNNVYYSSDEFGVLYDKDKTYLITYPEGNKRTSFNIPYSVTSIGDRAFSCCRNLTSIDIPDSVTSIGERAFEGCSSLMGITISDSVTIIGNDAFSNCSSLRSIEVDKNNFNYSSINGVLFDKQKTLMAYPTGKSDITYIIPDNVTSIGYGAFSGCSSLMSITIPDSVTIIGEGAFSYCGSLTNISIPNSVTSIGSGAFSGCSSLMSITIPDSVTIIGEGAFSYCGSLTNISIPDNVTSIGYDAFEGCSSLMSITIPDSVTTIGSYAFYKCSSLSTVYYTGTEEQWGNMVIYAYNDALIDANIIYVSNTQTTISADGKAFTVKPVNVEVGKTVILALYNGTELVEAQTAIYNGEDIPFTTDKSYTDVKVMVWDDLGSGTPVCETEEI